MTTGTKMIRIERNSASKGAIAYALAAGTCMLLISTSALSQSSEPTAPAGATASTSADDAKKKAYEAEEALAKAGKAAAEANKAWTEARTAEAQAKIGTVTGQSEIKGAIQAGSLAPKAEALLLVTQSTIEAAGRIKAAIGPHLGGKPQVLVLTDKAQLAVSDAVIFDLRRDQLLQEANLARGQFAMCPAAPAPARGATSGRIAPVAAIGTAIDLAAKLGSYFMTDYTYGEVTVDPSPELLASALVQSFAPETSRPRFVIASQLLTSDPTKFIEDLRPLHANYVEAVANRETAQRRAEAHRASSKEKAAQCDAAAAALGKVVTGHEALTTALVAEVEGKEPLGVRIVRQKRIQAKLAERPLILLLTGRQAAAYYTKKSLWTFLGGAPLYTMGGTSTTYTLFHGDSGEVVTGGAVAHHAGYRSVRQVERLFGSGRSSRGGRNGRDRGSSEGGVQ